MPPAKNGYIMLAQDTADMDRFERRNSMALDEAYFYCRQLESGNTRPELFMLLSAISTVDLALENYGQAAVPVTLSLTAWTRIRHSLFTVLLNTFSGYFLIYNGDQMQIFPGEPWPSSGELEFFPDGIRRKTESYKSQLADLHADTLNPLRWAFAEGRQSVGPADFNNIDHEAIDEDQQELLEEMDLVCEKEARLGKKKAHRRWWQLYDEANSCPNKLRKYELRKQMATLQSIWGRPEN